MTDKVFDIMKDNFGFSHPSHNFTYNEKTTQWALYRKMSRYIFVNGEDEGIWTDDKLLEAVQAWAELHLLYGSILEVASRFLGKKDSVYHYLITRKRRENKYDTVEISVDPDAKKKEEWFIEKIKDEKLEKEGFEYYQDSITYSKLITLNKGNLLGNYVLNKQILNRAEYARKTADKAGCNNFEEQSEIDAETLSHWCNFSFSDAAVKTVRSVLESIDDQKGKSRKIALQPYDFIKNECARKLVTSVMR